MAAGVGFDSGWTLGTLEARCLAPGDTGGGHVQASSNGGRWASLLEKTDNWGYGNEKQTD